jgi:hypothetical protein
LSVVFSHVENAISLTLQQYITKYAVQAAKRSVSAPVWQGVIGQPVGAFANATTDAALEAYIRQNSATYVPAQSTCRQRVVC